VATMKASGMPVPRLPAMWYDMDRLFEDFGGMPRCTTFFRGDGLIPELDVVEHSDCITIEAELPGVERADVSVTLADGMLTIKGEKKQEKKDKDENYYLAERSYGAFERALQLPEVIDYAKVEATFHNGVLKVIAPKRPEACKLDRKVEIKWVS